MTVRRPELRWRGQGVAEGVAVGRVLRLHDGAPNVYRAVLDKAADSAREIRRLRAAVRLARRQLLDIKERASHEFGADHAYIFDAHLLILEDRKLFEEIADHIQREQVNAEWAVKVVADRLLAIYAEIKDEYLRARGADIEDVMQRLIAALSGKRRHRPQPAEDAVVVAEDLLPSAMAELDFKHVRAIATDAGGWTSHTAIIARGLGIPAVVGLRDLFRRARTGDCVVVDASKGTVILHPSPATIAGYRAAEAKARPIVAPEGGREPLRTADGVEIILRANVELPAEYEGVRRYGARGIGLYRSEFLLSHRGVVPSEDEQCAVYQEIARIAGADGATIRLFDLGGDKLGPFSDEAERNPALGLRAIRFSLRREDLLRAQVRAILRAAKNGRLSLVLPMISDVAEVRRARRIIDEERARLEGAGCEIGPVRVGAMIEVPSAVLTADLLAREVDFFSLGTNDLVQYLLAVDRSNDEVADWFRSLHPAVLLSIDHTVRAARAAGIPVNVCGEMAASPAYMVVLIGLGVAEVSMNPSYIPRIRRTVAGIEARRAQEIAAECMRCATADEVEDLVRQRLGGWWPHLFPPELLPAPREPEAGS